MRRASTIACVAAFVFACSDDDTTPCNSPVRPAGPPPTATSGTIVEMDPDPSRVVYAVSDIHGGYDRLVALLAANHVIDGTPSAPDAVRWSAGSSILVVVGDLIDKGPQPVEVIDVLRALEASAPTSGGLVIVLLGNHEAEYFADASNEKASKPNGINKELADKGIDCGALASGLDPRGAWLRSRPLAARMGRWFFAHAGNTKGRTVAELDRSLREALAGPAGFGAPEIIGADSVLEARDWYADPSVATANARSLGVAHFVFGHDPNALGPRGAIAVAQDGLLVRIDCGMSPDVDDSTGCLLRMHREQLEDLAEQLTSDGRSTPLFRSVASGP